MCAGQCKDSREFCEQRCKLSQRACSTEMQEQALKDYEQYMREQLREHKQPDLHMSDFERPERCSTDYCDDDCEDDYQQCYVNCGGEIKRITSCRFLCF